MLIPEAGGDPLMPEEVYRGGQAIQIPQWQPWVQAALRTAGSPAGGSGMNIRMHGSNLHVRCFADIVSATRGMRPLPLAPLPSSLFQGTAEQRLYHALSLSQNRPQQFHLISVPRHNAAVWSSSQYVRLEQMELTGTFHALAAIPRSFRLSLQAGRGLT